MPLTTGPVPDILVGEVLPLPWGLPRFDTRSLGRMVRLCKLGVGSTQSSAIEIQVPK